MSVSFNGTSSKLIYTGNVRNVYPFSMFAWIKPANATADMMVGGSGNTSGGQELAMFASGTTAGDPVRAFSRDGASSVGPNSTTAIDTANWQPCLVVFTSTTSRTVYYAGGAAVSNTTSNNGSPNLHNRFTVGTRPYVDGLWFSGDIAEVAIWSSALTQTDFDDLAAGDLPETVAAGSLIDAWPLVDNADLTGVNGKAFAATSVSNGATHPITRSGGGASVETTATTALPTFSGSISVSPEVATGATIAMPTFSGSITSGDFSVEFDFTPPLPGFSGSISVSPSVSATTTVSLPAFSGSITIATGGATITITDLKDLTTGTLRASESGVTAIISDISTGELVAKLTGQTSTAGGDVALSHASLAAATEYRVTIILGDGSEGTWKYTAA